MVSKGRYARGERGKVAQNEGATALLDRRLPADRPAGADGTLAGVGAGVEFSGPDGGGDLLDLGVRLGDPFLVARRDAGDTGEDVAEFQAVGDESLKSGRGACLHGAIEDHWRYAQAATVASGTIEVQRMIVSKALLGGRS